MQCIPIIILGLFVTVSWSMRDKYGRKMILRAEEDERKNLACALAKICVHDTQEVCGAVDVNDDKRKYRRFLDTCDVLEYNCIYNKKYAVTDMDRCKGLDPIPPDTTTTTTDATTNPDTDYPDTSAGSPDPTDNSNPTDDTPTTNGNSDDKTTPTPSRRSNHKKNHKSKKNKNKNKKSRKSHRP